MGDWVNGGFDSSHASSQYTVAFSALRVRNTRSRHQDTIWIRIRVSVGYVVPPSSGSANSLPSIKWVDMPSVDWDGTPPNNQNNTSGRDFNNGYYDGFRNAGGQVVGPTISNIEDDTQVKVSFLVLNAGASPTDAEISKGLDAISSAAGTYGGVWGFVVAAITGFFSFLVGANCDGPVAADSFILTGQQIRGTLDNNSSYNWGDANGYVGPDSPSGCGSNSNYSCIVQFKKISRNGG